MRLRYDLAWAVLGAEQIVKMAVLPTCYFVRLGKSQAGFVGVRQNIA